MSRLRRRFRSSAALIGNLTYAAGQMLLLLMVARLAGLAELGLFTFALAFTAPIQLGLGLSLRSVRVVEDPAEFPLRLFVGQAVASGVLAIAISSGASAVLLADLDTWTVVTAVAVMKALESQIELVYGELQRRGRLDLVASSQVVRTVVMLALALFVLETRGSALGLALALVGAWSVAIGFQHLVVLPRSAQPEPAGALKETRARRMALIRKCWPLGVAAGVISLNGSLPRLVTFSSLGSELAGVFAILSYALVVMSIVGNSFGQTILSTLRDARIRGDDRSARRIARRQQLLVTVIGTLMITSILVVGEPLLRFALPGYDGPVVGPAVVFAVAATVGGLASIASYELMSTGRYKPQPLVNLAVTVVALPLLVFGADDGLLGIGAAMTLYLVFQWQVAQHVARHSLREPLSSLPAASRTKTVPHDS
jgi:O-antigen/teichoic acid export membrane protein